MHARGEFFLLFLGKKLALRFPSWDGCLLLLCSVFAGVLQGSVFFPIPVITVPGGPGAQGVKGFGEPLGPQRQQVLASSPGRAPRPLRS